MIYSLNNYVKYKRRNLIFLMFYGLFNVWHNFYILYFIKVYTQLQYNINLPLTFGERKKPWFIHLTRFLFSRGQKVTNTLKLYSSCF